MNGILLMNSQHSKRAPKLGLGLILLLVASSISALAQGALVFNNLGGYPVQWAPGMPKAGQNITASDGILVQLLWLNPTTSILEPVGPPVNRWPLRRGGVFNGGKRVLAATPGLHTWQIRAWQASYGADWQTGFNAALNGGGGVHQPVGGNPGGVIQFQAKAVNSSDIPHLPPWGLAQDIPRFQIGSRSD